MIEYKSWRIIDSKARWVITDSTGNIINKNPDFKRLKYLKKEILPHGNTRKEKYNKTNTCDICKIGFDKASGHPLREYNIERKYTGRWLCQKCHANYDPNSRNNILKSLANCRTGNQTHLEHIKSKRTQNLICRLYGWMDLNEVNDNYRTPIDCFDPKTGLYHQVQGRYYDHIRKYWSFGGFVCESKKNYVSIVCVCYSECGDYIERIYKFPKEEVIIRKSICIVKYDINDYLYEDGWYKKYRDIDKDELKRANDIYGNK